MIFFIPIAFPQTRFWLRTLTHINFTHANNIEKDKKCWAYTRSWARFNFYVYERPLMHCPSFICDRKVYGRTHVKITRHWKSTLSGWMLPGEASFEAQGQSVESGETVRRKVPPVLYYFRCVVSSGPTDCPWVSENARSGQGEPLCERYGDPPGSGFFWP